MPDEECAVKVGTAASHSALLPKVEFDMIGRIHTLLLPLITGLK